MEKNMEATIVFSMALSIIWDYPRNALLVHLDICCITPPVFKVYIGS